MNRWKPTWVDWFFWIAIPALFLAGFLTMFLSGDK